MCYYIIEKNALLHHDGDWVSAGGCCDVEMVFWLDCPGVSGSPFDFPSTLGTDDEHIGNHGTQRQQDFCWGLAMSIQLK